MKPSVLFGCVCAVVSMSSAALDPEADLFEPRPGALKRAVLQAAVPADPVELEQLARAGNAEAQYRLAMRYLQRGDDAPDPVKAFVWLRKAADAGHARAALYLGVAYRDGRGAPRDPALARRWLNVALAAGVPGASQALAAIQHAESLNEFERVRTQASRGDAQAQYETGMAYRYGRGAVSAEADEAFNWFRRAAEQNHAEAEYELGLMFRDANSGLHNVDTARHWLNRAASRGLLKARVALADLERQQQGTALAPAAAFRDSARSPFYQAALAGDANAQYELGLMYFNGDGGPRDYQQGVHWLRQAAAQNNVNAQLFLAERYARGMEIEGNYTEAAGWYARAARQGNAEAQFMLGNLFRLGLGVKASPEAARHWFTEAARQGHAKARDYLDEVLVSAR